MSKEKCCEHCRIKKPWGGCDNYHCKCHTPVEEKCKEATVGFLPEGFGSNLVAMTKDSIPEWEFEFDKQFPYEMLEVFKDKEGKFEPKTGVIRMKGIIKSYIRHVLSSQREAIALEIEGLKKTHKEDCINNEDGYGYLFRDCSQHCQTNGFNQALTDALTIIREK